MTRADVALVLCPPWGVENPPLGPAYLAAAVGKHHLSPEVHDVNLQLYRWSDRSDKQLWRLENDHRWRDERFVEALLDRWGPKMDQVAGAVAGTSAPVIGFTVVDPNEIFTAAVIRRVAGLDPGKVIVAGGPACWSTGQREDLQRRSGGSIRYFVAGEGEEALPELLTALRKGRGADGLAGVVDAAKGLEPAAPPRTADLAAIEFPAFDRFDIPAYESPSLALLWSRGCIGSCLFCKEKALWGKYRVRTVESILAELTWHQDRSGISRFVVYDSAVNGNPGHLDRICDGIIHCALDITWSAEAIPVRSLTRPRLHRMRAAGCHTLVFGVESGSERVLKAMNKPFDLAGAGKVLADASYAGIRVAVNILVGFPGEGEEEFGQTLDFLRSHREHIDRVDAISDLQVVDHTPLEERADALGIVLPEKHPSSCWYTRDGNTREVRLERVRRARELAEELGFEVGRSSLSGEGDRAPLKYRTRPLQLVRTLGRAGKLPGGLVGYGRELVRKKVRRALGERGIVADMEPGDREVLSGIEDGRRAFTGPQVVHLDLTDRCNLNCIACWDRSPLLGRDQAREAPTATLPTEAAIGFINDLFRLGGARQIKLGGGGEPTMHPDIDGIIAHIKGLPWNVELEINTNFTMADDEFIDLLVEKEVDSVVASLWAGDGVSYARTHPGRTDEDFETIVHALSRLAGRREGGGPSITIHNVLMNMNYKGVREMVSLGLAAGADAIDFVLVDPVPGKTDSLLPDREQLEELGGILGEMERDVDPFGTYRDPDTGRSIHLANFRELMRRCRSGVRDAGSYDTHMVQRMPCYIGWLFTRVMADGSVVPCCKGHRMVLGSILEDSFSGIWGSEPYREFRQRALTLPKSHPFFSAMGSGEGGSGQETGAAGGSGCRNCDNLMHNLVCHRKVLSRSSLLDLVRFEREKR